jgi:hypothetical protein
MVDAIDLTISDEEEEEEEEEMSPLKTLSQSQTTSVKFENVGVAPAGDVGVSVGGTEIKS